MVAVVAVVAVEETTPARVERSRVVRRVHPHVPGKGHPRLHGCGELVEHVRVRAKGILLGTSHKTTTPLCHHLSPNELGLVA